jgi:hypothetical protein
LRADVSTSCPLVRSVIVTRGKSFEQDFDFDLGPDKESNALDDLVSND